MARNSRTGSNRASGNNNSGRKKNPGNDWSGDVMDMARERPMAAAAVAAGAAAAGLFLWSKRSQISNQISNLSGQVGEWTENMSAEGVSRMFGSRDDTSGLTTEVQSGAARSTGRARGRTGMSETGGGNVSLGKASGGGGMASSASGRGHAQSASTVPK